MLILDGAMGTELIKRLGARDILDEYSIENPKVIEEISREYIEAGADIITTNTFNAHRNGRYSILELNKAAQDICVKLKKIYPKIKIAGCVGSGKGTVSVDEYREQINALDQVDYILAETVYDFTNVKNLLKAYENSERKSLIVSSCLLDKSKLFTLFDEVVKVGVEYIGLNCVEHSREVIELLRDLKSRYNVGMIYYPNSGKESVLKYREEVNVDIFGGCCGVGPDDYKNIAR